jgi:phosphoglycerol transferase MdoB-like AlkP superfamily enzyme
MTHITVDEELARKRFSGLQYGNQKIAEFLNKIRTSSLNDHTIVALTGDHSYWIAKGVGADQEFRRFAVPFYLKIPERYRPSNIDTSNFGSHEDIFPTLINLSLSDQSYVKMGDNLFGEEGEATNSSGLFANKAGAYHHGKYWKWTAPDSQIMEPTEPTPELEQLYKKSRGQIGLTDAFLKNEKNRKHSDEGNGQQ